MNQQNWKQENSSAQQSKANAKYVMIPEVQFRNNNSNCIYTCCIFDRYASHDMLKSLLTSMMVHEGSIKWCPKNPATTAAPSSNPNAKKPRCLMKVPHPHHTWPSTSASVKHPTTTKRGIEAVWSTWLTHGWNSMRFPVSICPTSSHFPGAEKCHVWGVVVSKFHQTNSSLEKKTVVLLSHDTLLTWG